MFDYTEEGGNFTVKSGEKVTVESSNEDWYYVTNEEGKSGYIPRSYVESVAVEWDKTQEGRKFR